MKVKNDDVKRVAKLSMFEISDDDMEMFRSHLENILQHVDRLNELDTENIEPSTYILDQKNIMRQDVVEEYGNREELLNVAVKTANGFFVVPQVVE